jgi:uncharacterized membrane protein YgcG
VAALVADLTAKDPAARPASAYVAAARAGYLRDAEAAGSLAPPPPGAWQVPPPARAVADQPTLAGAPLLVPPTRRAATWRDRMPAGRGGLLAMAAVVLIAGLAIAGLTGWLLAAAAGQPAHHPRAGVTRPTHSATVTHRAQEHRHGPPGDNGRGDGGGGNSNGNGDGGGQGDGNGGGGDGGGGGG